MDRMTRALMGFTWTPISRRCNGREKLRAAIMPVLGDLVIDFNAELRERAEAGNPFDYKRQFKERHFSTRRGL